MFSHGNHPFLCALSSFALLISCASNHGDGSEGSKPVGSDARPASRSIVVYYANETPDSAASAGRLDRLDSLLSRAWQQVPEGPLQAGVRGQLDKHRQFIRQDRVEFSAQVAKDIRGLEKQICMNGAYRAGTSLFVFTNKLAREGKFQFCLAGASPLPMETGSWPLALVESAISAGKGGAAAFAAFKDGPMVFLPSLRAARDIVQSKLPADGAGPFKLTFINKSHYAAGKVLTTRHPVDDPGISSPEGSGSSFINAVIADGTMPVPQITGVSAIEFTDELKLFPFPVELLVFDHANTAFDSATAMALRDGFAAIRGSLFFPPGQGSGYEGIAWGNVPPAADFTAAVWQVLKSR